MTDFTVFQQPAVTFEDLSWDLTPPEGGFVFSGTVNIGAFTAGQHFPNGYLPSGAILALATTGTYNGYLVPYLNAATAGTGDTAVGVLRASVPVTHAYGGTNRVKIGVAYLVHGVVSQARLPFTVGNAAAGGYIDAACKVDLPLIYWAA
jgi:hypothetical protein